MKCQRCGKETDITTMSWFNTQEICEECSEKEQEHPRFEEARAADEAACRDGNFNFKGIGWPGPSKS